MEGPRDFGCFAFAAQCAVGLCCFLLVCVPRCRYSVSKGKTIIVTVGSCFVIGGSNIVTLE